MKAEPVGAGVDARTPVGGPSNAQASSATRIAGLPEKTKGPRYDVSVESLGSQESSKSSCRRAGGG